MYRDLRSSTEIVLKTRPRGSATYPAKAGERRAAHDVRQRSMRKNLARRQYPAPETCGATHIH